MVISHNKRFVLLAPWKNASQTLRARLNRYNESPYPVFFYFNAYLNRVVHQHITIAEFNCLPESKLSYFTACFVRNPYDRVYSGFRQLKIAIDNQPTAAFPQPWIGDLVRRQLAEIYAQLAQAAFQFDEWLAAVRDEQIYEIGRNSNFPLHPGHYWTHIAGQLAVNFIGRVENFEEDFLLLLSKIGVDEGIDQVNANVVDMVGAAAGNPFGYRYIDRMSRASIDKINRLFAEDFELFEYDRVF
jgi:hypothetical protein